MSSEIGTVICSPDGPSPTEFSFVVTTNDREIPVRKGQFVELETKEGKVVATVMDVIKTNRYFMRPESVGEYERGGKPLTSIFPADRWEYIVAKANAFGIQTENGVKQVSFPASPGQKVLEASPETLTKFLGLDENDGVELGKLRYHDLPAKLNLTKLLRKHVSVLAMSGSGKSYCAAILIEELLDRLKEKGRVASIVVDAHGEYTSLATPSKNADYSDRTSVVKGRDVRIGVPNLTAYQFREFIPDMSGSQVRELSRVLRKFRGEMRSGGKAFGLGEVIARIEENNETHKHLRRALLDRLYDLRSLGVFGKHDYPCWEKIVNPGEVAILDLNDTLNLRKKQVVVTYIARKLFNSRKAGRSPPFVLFLEEAHQFAPSTDSAISSSIIRTIAREGRKFYASLVLISQRPVRLSTTVLSQANTNIILRITNPYDLDHIKQSSERITKETIEMISSLPVGEALVVGEAINQPLFIKVRKRRSQEAAHGASLEDIAKKFEHSRKRRREDARAFM
ncbi:MAG: ATP-binding protein [Candidatus Hadarchaeota archaeon]|nr:ATP-binding protein [Candidatus Hadarchaeota archaeon]